MGQNRDVFVTPSSGGPVRRITAWDSEEGRPSWSPDGKTIYFRSDKSGRRELWMAAFPQGEPVPVTKTGAYEAFAALDGSLYLVRGRDEHGLWRHSAGGRPELVIPGVREGRWSMTAHGIVYQDFPGRTIKKYAFATRKTTHLLDLPGAAPIETGLSASPDGNAVLFTQTDEDTVDIMLARLRP